MKPSVSAVLEFFIVARQGKVGYSCLNTAMSAVSSLLIIESYQIEKYP